MSIGHHFAKYSVRRDVVLINSKSSKEEKMFKVHELSVHPACLSPVLIFMVTEEEFFS